MGGSPLYHLEMEGRGGPRSGCLSLREHWPLQDLGGMRYPKQRAGQPILPAKPTVPREQNRTDLGLRAFPRAPGNPLLARETKRITANILLDRFKCDTYT